MLIDCFTFYNEIDVLEFRLIYLSSVVDKFILVEATQTHAGNDKPLFYDEVKDDPRFARFKDRIIHIIVDNMPEGAWARENFQRNGIDIGVKRLNLRDTDMLMVSDVDEIPNRDYLNSFPNTTEEFFFGFVQTVYYYNLHNKSETLWYEGTRLLNYVTYKKFECPQNIRMTKDGIFPFLKNGGWHFTYFGNVDHVKNKIRNFAHQEFNTDEVLAGVDRAYKRGEDYTKHYSGNYQKIIHHEIIDYTTLPEHVQMLNKN